MYMAKVPKKEKCQNNAIDSVAMTQPYRWDENLYFKFPQKFCFPKKCERKYAFVEGRMCKNILRKYISPNSNPTLVHFMLLMAV